MLKSVHRFACRFACGITCRISWALGALLFVGPVFGQNQKAVDQPQSLDNAIVAKSAANQELAKSTSTTSVAPLGYRAEDVTNFKGIYIPLVSTNSQRVPFSTTDLDDNTSGAVPIGFTFKYRGTSYTSVSLNTNGFLMLGDRRPSRPNLFFPEAQVYTNDAALYSSTAADSNILSPFNVDLVTAATLPAADFRYTTTLVPNTGGLRMFTIQWSNLRDKLGGQLERIFFQVRLYEGTNFIDFVYGNWVAAQVQDSFVGSAIGIKGVTDQYIFCSHASSTQWGARVPLWRIKNKNFVGVNQFN